MTTSGWERINPFPPRPAKTIPFIILLSRARHFYSSRESDWVHGKGLNIVQKFLSFLFFLPVENNLLNNLSGSEVVNAVNDSEDATGFWNLVRVFIINIWSNWSHAMAEVVNLYVYKYILQYIFI